MIDAKREQGHESSSNTDISMDFICGGILLEATIQEK